MGNMDETRGKAMNFYCNDPKQGARTNSSDSNPFSNYWWKSACRVGHVLRIKKNAFWIQLSLLLFILPAGTHVRSESNLLPPRPLPATFLQPNTNSSLSTLTAGFQIPVPKGGKLGLGLNPSPTQSNPATSTSSGEALLDEEFPFENNTFSNTTVSLGDTAFLKCSVRNTVKNYTIHWIRRRDMHIISVDRNIYTNDNRFHILNFDHSEDWVLQIKYVQKRDNGTYECQVSTGKGISSYSVHLFVAVPEAFILGNGEYHIQEGSTINLVCIVEKSPKPPDYIFWYHNDRMINYDKDRNLRIQTDTGSKTHSRLIIETAQVSDSGNYTCHISNAEPTSTYVYISQGDKMAAIQKRKSAGSLSAFLPLLYELLSLLLLSYFN